MISCCTRRGSQHVVPSTRADPHTSEVSAYSTTVRAPGTTVLRIHELRTSVIFLMPRASISSRKRTQGAAARPSGRLCEVDLMPSEDVGDHHRQESSPHLAGDGAGDEGSPRPRGPRPPRRLCLRAGAARGCASGLGGRPPTVSDLDHATDVGQADRCGSTSQPAGSLRSSTCTGRGLREPGRSRLLGGLFEDWRL